MSAYYNEFDPYAAAWLRNLIYAGLIASGDVDERSIVDVRPDDLKGYVQCHFFAGIGGWSYAARLAGWPDERPLWTGSCPCQPFSVAGKQEGQSDERHLWPAFFGLIRSCRPDVVMGEQVAAAVGKHWLDGVHSDLESIGYACGATVVPACAVDAPHRRDRLWFVADASCERRYGREDAAGRDDAAGQEAGWRQSANRVELHSEDALAHADEPCEGQGREQRGGQFSRLGGHSEGCSFHAGNSDDTGRNELRNGSLGEGARGEIQAWSGSAGTGRRSHWADSAVTSGRRIEPSIRLLAHGVPARVGKLRAYGNAIVPQVAAEVIGAYLDLAA
jgi:DNA (cytosine-5)-methyltransferase 1